MRNKRGEEKNILDYAFPDIIDSLRKKIVTCRFPAPRFDQAGCTVVFAGVEIPIPKNSDQELLCQTLLKGKASRSREWSWDEVLESWGETDYEKGKWRRVYNAAREVNFKVAMETTVKDLLSVRKYSVKVNPKHCQ
jgi:hypothetical protein